LKILVSQAHILTKLISENSLSQSWLAINQLSGKKCFIKTANPNSAIGQDNANQVLNKSYELQRKLKSHVINRAVTRYSCNGQQFIEYPFLEDQQWSTLSSELFFRFFPSSLVQIALILDYIHAMNLVHCDVKFENFRISNGLNITRIVLCDLDFLSEANTRPDSRLFGTPGLIAPELKNNEIILPQSDNYSLGKSLLLALEQNPGHDSALLDAAEIKVDTLRQIAEILVDDFPGNRPVYLLSMLARFNLIDNSDLEQRQRSLFGMKLTSDLWVLRRKLRKKQLPSSYLLSESNKVFGIDREILGAIDKNMKAHNHQKLFGIKRLIEQSSIKRHGEFWHLGLDDSAAADILNIEGKSLIAGQGRKHKGVSSEKKATRELLKLIYEHKRKGMLLSSWLLFKKLEKEHGLNNLEMGTERLATFLAEMAGAAQALGRISEALLVFERVLAIQQLKRKTRLQVLSSLGTLALQKGETSRAAQVLEQGMKLAEEIGDCDFILAAKRQLATIELLTLPKEDAIQIVGSLIAEAKRIKSQIELGKLLVLSGLIQWRSGSFESAEKDLLSALKHLNKSPEAKDMIAPLANLAMVYFEQADYQRSVKYGLKAINISESVTGVSLAPAVYVNLVLSFIRLADYENAHYWLEKYLSSGRLIGDSSFYRTYYFLKGHFELKIGQVHSGMESLNTSLYLYNLGQKDRNLGKVHFNLAVAALYQANKENFSKFIASAKEVFSGLADNASLQECHFLENLYSMVYDKSEPSPLLIDLESLLSFNCRYYSVYCLFAIQLFCEKDARDKASSLAGNLINRLQLSEVPVFRATSDTLSYHRIEDKDLNSVFHLKNAFAVLVHSKDLFYALLVSRIIGRIYESLGKRKLALAYYEQGAKLADRLGNNDMKNEFSERQNGLALHEDDSARIISVLSGISEVLKNLSDYDLALQKLVEYGVEETGAERGVLLVRHEQKKEYYAKTYVNFDPENISDVKMISSHVTNRVAAEITPMIIEDALSDDRTRNYKSVIANNILSVLCVPIRAEGEIKGVLYLDHHVIPALFKPQDVIFINSIANFISTLYSMIQDYRSKEVSARQLKQDLGEQGMNLPLVTKNAKMKDLLSNLDKIAKSNAPVLILGESGTGKEMLAQYLHSLSFRSNKQLIKMNCAAIAPTLIESELFGIARNVATGVDEREGKLSAADSGTLLLDEIGDLPLEAQSKILRAIENQEFEKV
jgi:serine/threonine protein kinase/tetratricopeptide (TPR) repeat protein